MPFAFASHFAPDHLADALAIYRRDFRPSEAYPQPYALACIAVFAADTDAEARRLFTSLQQSFVNLRRGRPGLLPPPVDRMDGLWSGSEKAMVDHSFREAVVGSPDTVRRGVEALVERTGLDELMITAAILDHDARVRSFELAAQACRIEASAAA